MKLYEYINETELKAAVDAGYISIDKHPDADLYIYNYTHAVQYANAWNDTICKCRGLIVDGNMNIICRPFKKFFNYEELDGCSIPVEEPVDIYEKIDGSLGILYNIGDELFVTTKGSFASDQGKHATGLLRTKYAWAHEALMKLISEGCTALFEIVYPENHLVVSYGSEDALYALTVIDNETGAEYLFDINAQCPPGCEPFRLPKLYDGRDWKTIRNEVPGANKEGFVIMFRESGFRIKMKYDEYKQICFLKTGMSDKRILKHFIDGTETELEDSICKLDEESREMYRKRIDSFTAEFDKICGEAAREYVRYGDPKEAAERYSKCRYPHLMFAMSKGQSIVRAVWKTIDRNRREDR